MLLLIKKSEPSKSKLSKSTMNACGAEAMKTTDKEPENAQS